MTGSELFPIVSETSKSLREAVGTTLADVWQGLLGDKVTAWRLRNAAAVSEKLGKELAKTGQSINLDKIPEGVAYAWFQKATETEEPEIQALFAKLLANAADGHTDALKKLNIDLISRLTLASGTLLGSIARQFRDESITRSSMQNVYIDFDEIDVRYFDDMEFSLIGAVDELIALGIINIDNSQDAHYGGNKYKELAIELSISRTARDEFNRMRWSRNPLFITGVGESLIGALFPLTSPHEAGFR